MVPPSLVGVVELDVLLEFLPLKLDDRVVARAVSMIHGKESHGRLIAAVGVVPAGTFGQEPNANLERKVSSSRTCAGRNSRTMTMRDGTAWKIRGRRHDQSPLICEVLRTITEPNAWCSASMSLRSGGGVDPQS